MNRFIYRFSKETGLETDLVKETNSDAGLAKKQV